MHTLPSSMPRERSNELGPASPMVDGTIDVQLALEDELVVLEEVKH